MTSYTRCWIALATIHLSVAADPVRTLPSPPGQILDLRANAAGDIYIRTATKILWMDLQNTEEGWNALALDGVVDITDNAGREVFARQDLKTRFAIHRLAGGEATPVTTTPNVPCDLWYVDALGRVWIQTGERLLVVGKEEALLDMPAQRYGPTVRQPCEWRPGHVALICGPNAIWATPEKVTVDPAPPFAGDSTCVGPFRLGPDHLLAGCDRRSFRISSGRIDPNKPSDPPERLNLGWDWFYGMVTAPDGRLLVLGQTDRNPKFTFFWYAADGRSQVDIKGSDDVIRTGRSKHGMAQLNVVFAASSVGFAAISDGTLAVFGPEEVSLLAPDSGLPIPRVERLAVVGDDLILAGDGKMAVWRTTEPLPQAAGIANRPKWKLAGPCVRDSSGTMWAFLFDFPGKLSSHDGKEWRHLDMNLGNRIPQRMSVDDKGRLQIGFQDTQSGSCLVTDGIVTNWPNAPTRAWDESVTTGATRFSDGSTYLWAERQAPPLSVGLDGIAVGAGAGRLPVVYEGKPKMVLSSLLGHPAGNGAPRSLAVQNNEAFVPAAGGGWMGPNRIFYTAVYPVSGRVYPGTNGLYMLTDNTLRFQAPQKLTIAGEVVSTGTAHRLDCRIAGSEPLYKLRILTFFDGEFADRIAAPEGGDLPSLQPGLHEIEVYAADGFGVVSDEPLRLTLDGGPSAQVTTHALDDAWTLNPRRLQALPATVADRKVMGRALEIDSAGVVWILIDGGVMAIDLAHRQAAFHKVQAHSLSAARGWVWAVGPGAIMGDTARLPIYEFRQDGARRAAELYADPRYAEGPIHTDMIGGIWTIGHRTASRWDGQRTQRWERDIGHTAQVLPHPEGLVIQCYGYCFVYRNGDLSPAISWGQWEGVLPFPVCTLGRDSLVVPSRGAIIDLIRGGLREVKFPRVGAFRSDGNGNLYVWRGKQLSRFSSEDMKETQLAPCTPPAVPPMLDSGAYQFLGTTNGVLAYSYGRDRLIIGSAAQGAADYGWQEGVRPGNTIALREAPDGRIWILRSEQLLVYDPAQPAGTNALAWSGWRLAPALPTFTAGGFGNVWYWTSDRRTLIRTDGTNEVSWKMTGGGDLVVSDQGSAVVNVAGATFVLIPNQPPKAAPDMQSGVLKLVSLGVREFAGREPPAVAADGRVYFRGNIWDGRTWNPVPKGRASRDLRGELYLLCENDWVFNTYRIEGIKPTPLEYGGKCLVDTEGLRWFDPGLLEAKPGCMPVLHTGKGQRYISTGADTRQIAVENYMPVSAFPSPDGIFLVRVHPLLYVLDGNGMTKLSGDRVPCGAEVNAVHLLANGRFAFVTGDRIFISPPDLLLNP